MMIACEEVGSGHARLPLSERHADQPDALVVTRRRQLVVHPSIGDIQKLLLHDLT